MEILILLGLIVVNGLFAMSEIALVTARKARLAALAEAGDRAAAAALKLGEDPTKFLSTVQIGITSIGLLNGIVGEAILAAPLSLWLQGWGMDAEMASVVSTILVVVGVTYVSIVVGELVPKRLGQISPEPIARLVAPPMLLLAFLTRPFVALLTFSTKALMRLLRIRESAGSGVTQEEIHALLREGTEAGAIDHEEHAMVRNVFHLDNRLIGTLMIPRSDIVFLDLRRPLEENLARILDVPHSRFPVCSGGLQDVRGLVHAKQVLQQMAKGVPVDLEALAQAPIYVPESLSGLELLEQFKRHGVHIAMVVDEYGEIEGLITLHDVLEAVTGELSAGSPEDSWAVRREDGSWLLDGSIPVPELKERLGIRSVPEESRGRYRTVSGLIIQLLGNLPHTGAYVEWDGWRFEVVDMDGKRIDKVLAARVSPPSATAG